MDYSDWETEKLEKRAKMLQKDIQKDESLVRLKKLNIKENKILLLKAVKVLDKRKEGLKCKYLKKKF